MRASESRPSQGAVRHDRPIAGAVRPDGARGRSSSSSWAWRVRTMTAPIATRTTPIARTKVTAGPNTSAPTNAAAGPLAPEMALAETMLMRWSAPVRKNRAHA